LLVERASLDWVGGQPGDVLTIELPSKKVREIPLVGVVHDITQPLSSFSARRLRLRDARLVGETATSTGWISWSPTNRWTSPHQGGAQSGHQKVERSGRKYSSPGSSARKHPATVRAPDDPLLGVLGVLALFSVGSWINDLGRDHSRPARSG
jgi:hypothetical protein